MAEGDQKSRHNRGLPVLALQNPVPDARVLYVSATGATVVSNLAYASRLGLWGTGRFPFYHTWRVCLIHGGGRYCSDGDHLARSQSPWALSGSITFSYAGVEYDMLVHELTPAQVAIYDSYAEAYQIIHNNLEKALEASGITGDEGTLNPQAKSAARSDFESNKQRFFNHLITAMKCPSMIKSD